VILRSYKDRLRMKKIAASVLLASAPPTLVYVFTSDLMKHSDVRELIAGLVCILVLFNVITGICLLFKKENNQE
jgi:hypothetical protein